MTKFKLFVLSALLTTTIVDAIPCGTGGAPEKPTPDTKSDTKGETKAPSTPRPNK